MIDTESLKKGQEEGIIWRGWQIKHHQYGPSSLVLKLPLIEVVINENMGKRGILDLFINNKLVNRDKDELPMIEYAQAFIRQEYAKIREWSGE